MKNKKANTANAVKAAIADLAAANTFKAADDNLNKDKSVEIYSKINNTLDKILKVAEDINSNIIKLHKSLHGGL